MEVLIYHQAMKVLLISLNALGPAPMNCETYVSMYVPDSARTLALLYINAPNYLWSPHLRRLVILCLAGSMGLQKRDTVPDDRWSFDYA